MLYKEDKCNISRLNFLLKLSEELAKENIAKRIPQNSLKKILQKKTMELSRAEKRENGSKICRQNCKGGKSANECNSCKKTLCNKCIGKKKEEEEEKRELC